MTTQCISAEYASLTNETVGLRKARNPLTNVLQHWQLYRKRKAGRAAVKELASLDDIMLRDIGISRGDVMWASQLPQSVDASIELEIIARRR